jgi:transcriptional regulator GlxA family with amidase domain
MENLLLVILKSLKTKLREHLEKFKKSDMKNYKICLLGIFALFVSLSKVKAQTADEAKKHQEMMDIIMQKPKTQIRTIGIFIYDGFNNLDAMGPFQVLRQVSGAKTFLIAKQKGLIKNNSGVKVQVDTTIAEVKNLDIILIPGGAMETLLMTKDTAVINWIRQIDKTSKYTTSVCTGAWILGATGLLQNKHATTNWYRAEEMLTNYGAKFEKKRYVIDGKYWTSAGVSAGIDMSLAIVNDLFGEKYTQGIMLDLEYDPQPPFNAGSVDKTQPIVADMMRTMYDMIMLPTINKFKKE